jgi:hypothetical protein
MKSTIIYDEHGNIAAISKVLDPKTAGGNVTGGRVMPGKGQHMLEVDLTHELAGMPLLDIHKHYRVDHRKSKLVKKD